MKKINKDIYLCGLFILIAILYTILVKYVDVKPIGPNNSLVGFAFINKITLTLGYHKIFYVIAQILGYVSFLIVFIYGLIGLMELIERKSLKKVDYELLCLGGFYVLMLLVYVFFEKVIINYRPVLMDKVLEASYPSSHTVLAICVCVSSLMINKTLFKKKKFIKYENIISKILLISIVLCRILSGVHWITDIIGGILISIALLKLFDVALKSKFVKEK